MIRFVPDQDETVAQVFYRDASHPEQPKLAPDKNGFIWMPDDGFRRAVAHRRGTIAGGARHVDRRRAPCETPPVRIARRAPTPALAVAALYLPCRWYGGLKARRSDGWMKIL